MTNRFDDNLSYDYKTSRLNKSEITIYWDPNNRDLDSNMKNDLDRAINNRKDFYWLEIVKKVSNWRWGEQLYFYAYLDDIASIKISSLYKHQTDKDTLFRMKLDVDGFFHMRMEEPQFNFTEVNCKYNDIRGTLDWMDYEK